MWAQPKIVYTPDAAAKIWLNRMSGDRTTRSSTARADDISDKFARGNKESAAGWLGPKAIADAHFGHIYDHPPGVAVFALRYNFSKQPRIPKNFMICDKRSDC